MNNQPENILSGTSPIQVKFIGWLVVVVAGGFGGWIWWAASMSTKLDVVISNQTTQMAATKQVAEDVARLKEWRTQMEIGGSPVQAKQLDDLRISNEALRRDFERHVLTTGSLPSTKQ